MKIFSLFANTILAMVGETPLDAPLTWSFVTCITILVTKRRYMGGQALVLGITASRDTS